MICKFLKYRSILYLAAKQYVNFWLKIDGRRLALREFKVRYHNKIISYSPTSDSKFWKFVGFRFFSTQKRGFNLPKTLIF